MGGAGWAGLRRSVAFVVVVSAFAAGLSPVGVALAQEEPEVEWWDDLVPSTPEDDPEAPVLEPGESAPVMESEPVESLDARSLPEPVSREISLGEVGESRGASGLPIDVEPTAAAAEGAGLEVEVLDEAVAERLSAAGFAFRLSSDGSDGDDAVSKLPLSLSVDYSGFAGLYGAGFTDRLRVVTVPECALVDPVPEDCEIAGMPLPTRNDREGERLVVEVDDLTDLPEVAGDVLAAAGDEGSAPSAESDEPEGVVFALMAGPSGEEGTFQATSLSLAGDWNVSLGSGEFTYTYEVPVPEAPAGPTPGVGLSYSSGAVDGMVSTANTQAPPTGVGWSDFATSFIERRYNACGDDGITTGDLCWHSHNATISLNGQSSELVPVGGPGGAATSWRLKNDPRWKVERLTGASNGDEGDASDAGEHWKVTTPDGTEYFFGIGENPDVPGAVTDSAWTVPVIGDDGGEPCNTEVFGVCDQAWRWNLDRVIDPNGNVQMFIYEKEENRYGLLNGIGGNATPYVRGGTLQSIWYGKREGSTALPQAKVEFETLWRCNTLDAPGTTPCPAPSPATAAQFLDVPVDLMCETACTVVTPTFFSARRYSKVETWVNVDGHFEVADDVALLHTFQNPDPNPAVRSDEKLYLIGLQRTGHTTAGSPVSLPAVTFFPGTLNNRVDTAGGAVSAMPHWRIAAVTDELGGQVVVTYGRPHPCPDPIPDPPEWDLNTRDCFPQWFAPDGGDPGFAIFHKYLVTQVEVRDTTGGSPWMITTYAYGDQIASVLPAAWNASRDEAEGAWHHDRDVFVPNSEQTWSEWRGYEDVLVTQGTTRSRYKLHRGMDGDRLAGDPFPGPGSRVATISSLDGAVVNTPDSNWLAGLTLDDESRRTDGTVQSGVRHAYQALTTIDITSDPDPLSDARWVGEVDTFNRRRSGTGVFASRRTQTVYNGLLLFPERVIEHGWVATTGDERCTKTDYVSNLGLYMIDYPFAVTRYGNSTCTGAELSRAETAYDGGAFGAGPTRDPVFPRKSGNPTSARTKLTATPTTTWATSSTT